MLVAEVDDLRADYKRLPLGVVIESHLDPQKGHMATVLVRTGTLKEGQDIIAGSIFWKSQKTGRFQGTPAERSWSVDARYSNRSQQSPNINDVLQGVGRS